MNFAYLDARSIIESVLQEAPEPLEPVPCELDERWKQFEGILARFKNEFAQTRREYAMKMAELNETRQDISAMRRSIETLTNQDLKMCIESVLDNHESEKGAAALTQQCRELLGRTNEMQRVLRDTSSERYAKFTCFVCMDRLVDVFIDPCGHVMCERCWALTRDKTVCPGCRQRTLGARKIFLM